MSNSLKTRLPKAFLVNPLCKAGADSAAKRAGKPALYNKITSRNQTFTFLTSP